MCPLAGAASAASVDEVAAILRKEQLNSYGIMAPPAAAAGQYINGSTNSTTAEAAADADGARRVRGGALYPRCALVNHECLPNAARFDAFDWVPSNWPTTDSTAVVLRAMHDLPPDTEVVISYFPLNWTHKERQEQAQQVGGARGGRGQMSGFRRGRGAAANQ